MGILSKISKAAPLIGAGLAAFPPTTPFIAPAIAGATILGGGAGIADQHLTAQEEEERRRQAMKEQALRSALSAMGGGQGNTLGRFYKG